jgi:hypothetical protein
VSYRMEKIASKSSRVGYVAGRPPGWAAGTTWLITSHA